MKRETRVERITRYETMLNEVTGVLRAAERALKDYEEARPKIRALEEYYASAAWKRDFSASEKGELPEGLPCGVLSEDGIYNMLDDEKEYLESLRRLITESEAEK